MLAFIIFPTLSDNSFVPINTLLQLINAIIGEVLVGLISGLAANMVFTAIRVGGQYLDLQMGFAMAQVFDPTNGTQNTLVAQLLNILGILLFFSVDAHHSLIFALAKSFEYVGVGGEVFSGSLTYSFIQVFLIMIKYALKIAAPVILVLLITDISLGLISKTVPQFNVLMMGFPIKIGLGIITLMLFIPVFGTLIGTLFKIMEREIMIIFKGF